VLIAGNGVDGLPLDLSGIVISTSMRADNTEGVIEFSSPLPDVAKYRIGLDGVTDAAGQSIEGGTDIVLTALRGDVSGDRRVNVTDLSYISATYRDPIDPNFVQQVRADVTLDGRTNVTDLSRAWAQRNNDTRSIPDPEINVGDGEGGDLSPVDLQAISLDVINAMAFAEGGAFKNANSDSTKNKKQLR
jgi:hypothetical protein